MDFTFLSQQVATGEKATTYFYWIVKGYAYTGGSALLCFSIAMILGLGIGIARTLPGMTGKVSNWSFEIIRSIPLIVLLFLTYQVIPTLLFPELIKHLDFLTVTLWAGITGLSIFTSMRVSSHVFSAISSLGEGQRRAGVALGFSKTQIYRLILVPQAMKSAIPALTSEFLSTVKNTSALSAIGLLELTKQTQNIMDNTSALYEPFVIILFCYFSINMIVLWIMKTVDKKLFEYKGGSI